MNNGVFLFWDICLAPEGLYCVRWIGEVEMKLQTTLSLLLIGWLAGCDTAPLLPSKFTMENIERLRVGMTSEEVKTLFGNPSEIDRRTCGTSTEAPWNCEMWSYKKPNYKTDRMTFQVLGDMKLLNNWSVSRD